MNNLLKMMIRIKSQENPGAPVLLADLRRLLPAMSKPNFDQAVLNLAKSGEYFLSRHFHPAQATDAEKKSYIPDGAGNYYIAINPHEVVKSEPAVPEQEIVKSVPDPLKAEPIATIRRGRPPLPKQDIPDGERFATRKRGRPPIPEHLRRIQIRPGYRVPAWIAAWMKEQRDIGKVIEKAVVGFYGLTPPKP